MSRGLETTLPSIASIHAIRTRLTPRAMAPTVMGVSSTHHVALTFDDGPDPRSTPHFLDALAERGVRATFFVLGRHLDAALLRVLAAPGHEIGVHGWDHAPTIVKRPGQLRDEITRTRDLVEDITGTRVAWYRPPYGWMTRETTASAAAAGLRLVLWSAWGRDWRRRATPDTVEALVSRQARPGGTVLLHDTDRCSAPGSWLKTLGATRRLLARWDTDRLPVGPLAEHWPR
jgi:peptidoglycan/xylan/chitin deacetylase (PgdA/CDA1 family)